MKPQGNAGNDEAHIAGMLSGATRCLVMSSERIHLNVGNLTVLKLQGLDS
jgi:hypothetical protein